MKKKINEEFWELLDCLTKQQKIIIDRPRGSTHPKYKNYIYPLDYGYLEETISSDGSGIDVWVGTLEGGSVTSIICSVDILKKDSEIKILYKCTKEEEQLILKEHNRSDKMKGILISRI